MKPVPREPNVTYERRRGAFKDRLRGFRNKAKKRRRLHARDVIRNPPCQMSFGAGTFPHPRCYA